MQLRWQRDQRQKLLAIAGGFRENLPQDRNIFPDEELFLMASLQDLRNADDWERVLRGTLGETSLGKPGSVRQLRRELTGRRCLLLECAAHAQQNGGLAAGWELLKKYPPRKLVDHLQAVCVGYDARWSLLRLLAEGDPDATALTRAIVKIVDATAGSWQFKSQSNVQDLANLRMPSDCEPSFMRCFPSDEWRSIFRTLAAKNGWLHPGLLLAGETLAAFFGDRRSAAATVRTSILFAVADPHKPQGIVARLRMERLSEGCGALLPDAWSAGYLRMDQRFSNGLQHAWHAVQQLHPAPCDFDWRWSLDLYHATKHLLGSHITVPLSGSSAEVAFACAMRAVDSRDPQRPTGGDALDPYVAATAQFAKPRTERLVLAPVTSVGIKTLAGQFMERRIREVVLAEGHDEADIPPSDEHLRFPRVETFHEAYQLLSRGPRITRAVKQSMYAAATALRIKLCGQEVSDWQESGRRYVPSPLAEILPVSVRDTPLESSERQERTLTSQERSEFRRGRWQSPQNSLTENSASTPRAERIRLFADSGLGKSVQLLICEQSIARAKGNRIPVRLGKTDKDSVNLSAINWSDDPEVVLRNIYARCVAPHVPASPHDFREGAYQWFRDLVRAGRVVFLLDALDQSRQELEGLGSFLNSAPLQACVAILAGRPETRFSKSEAFEGLSENDWSTLRVLPFGKPEQERFLGSRLSPVLIPKDEVVYSWEDDYAEEVRRHQWKDLLGIPLLLSFLKLLAGDSSQPSGKRLQDLTNRYEIYREAIAHLITKGLSTLPGKPQMVRQRVLQLLPLIAFEAVRRHAFSGVVEGDAFAIISENVGDDLYAQLLQVDLVTEHGVFDAVGTEGLEFRHRSMLEYFAGCRLAELFAKPATRAEVIDVLRDVHSVLDEHGDFRQDLLNEDGKTCRDLPTDWQWTLRFALAHATGKVRDDLAWQLIRFGNPWVVYDALEQDHLTLSEPTKQVCSWLVHRDWGRRDYQEAWDATTGPPVDAWIERCNVGAKTQNMTRAEVAAGWLAELFDRSTRDGAFLHPLVELLTAVIDASRVDSGLTDLSVACEAALEGYRQESLTSEQFATTFVPIPAGEFAPISFHDNDKLENAGITGRVTIPAGLQMADFPVTNAELERWCPTHRRWRDRYSDEEDQPSVHVSWYMAVEYCVWLTAQSPEEFVYGLPTEWEWEFAARWGTSTKFWWGNEERTDLMNSSDSKVRLFRTKLRLFRTKLRLFRTNSRAEALERFRTEGTWHPSREASPPGLLDVHGNVFEWCDSRSEAVGSSRVLRGGSWGSSDVDCRSADRNHVDPGVRSNFVGFRIVCRLSLCECSQSSSD